MQPLRNNMGKKKNIAKIFFILMVHSIPTQPDCFIFIVKYSKTF